MNGAMIEYSIRAFGVLAVFLIIAYFLFRHIESVKSQEGLPADTQNYGRVLYHYFGKFLFKKSDKNK